MSELPVALTLLAPDCSGLFKTSWDVPMLQVHCVPGPSCPRLYTWDILGYPMLQVSQDVHDYLGHPGMSPCCRFAVFPGFSCPRMSGLLGTSWDVPMLHIHCIQVLVVSDYILGTS